VVIEHGAEIDGDRDLIRAHECLEDGDTGLARKIGFRQRLHVGEHGAMLLLQRGHEVRHRHPPPLIRHVVMARVQLEHGKIGHRK
jgi:hypothetical protein